MADPKLRYELVVDDKGTASIKSFNSSLDTAGRKASTVSGKIGGIAGKAAKLAGKLTAVGAAGAAAFAGWGIKKAIGQFATFETQLAKLKNLGVDSLGAIKDQIMALPSELGSATEMVAGYYQVLSAGIKKGKNAIDVLVTSAKLAKAAHLDQATAVKAVTSGMKAFDTSAKETANSLMKIEQTGMTEVRLLANYFGEIAGQADAMNLKLEETSSALAAVSQMSGTTEKGATQLRALFRELISPTDELNELFKDMGGTMRAIEQVGLAGVLERIEKATGGSAVKIEKLFGSAEAAAAATSLLSKNMQYFNDALDAQKNKAGALEETWNTFKDTLNAIWDTFKNTVGRIAIEIGEDLAPTVKNLVTQTSEWLKVNKELITVKISDWLSGITQWIDKIDLSKLDFAVVAEKGDKLINALSTMAKDIGTVAEAAGKLLGVLDKAIKKANSWAEKMGFAWKIISRDYQGLVQDVMAGSDKIAGKHAETAATVKKNPIEVTADTSDAEAEVGRLKDKTQDLDAKANVTADTSDAEAEVYQFKNKTEDLLAEANVTADTTAGKKRWRSWSIMLKASAGC